MSSLDNIYMKMAPSLEPADLANLHHEPPPTDAQKLIGREVAHELNNILTILRGYADRVMRKCGDNPAMLQDLKVISDNVKRAEAVVRQATIPRSRPTTIVGG